MNVWGICWLTLLNRCHLITVIVSGSCLWWETGIHDTSCINSCIWSSCAAAWIKHLYPINVTSRCSYWLYPHGGGVCVLFWTHGHLHGLDVTHRWEATWKLNGLICLIASGLQTSIFVPAATRPLVLRRVFMPVYSSHRLWPQEHRDPGTQTSHLVSMNTFELKMGRYTGKTVTYIIYQPFPRFIPGSLTSWLQPDHFG